MGHKQLLKRAEGMHRKRNKEIENGTIPSGEHKDRYQDKKPKNSITYTGPGILDEIQARQKKEDTDSVFVSYRRTTVTETLIFKRSPDQDFESYKNDIYSELSMLSNSIKLKSEKETLDSIGRIRNLLENPLVKRIESEERKRISFSIESLETFFLASRVACINDQYFNTSDNLIYLMDLKDSRRREMEKYFAEFEEHFSSVNK